MNETLSLFILFFKMGLFSFGGGLIIIALMQSELIARGLMSAVEAANMVAIAEMTPGPFAVNATTFAGMRIYGPGGAALMTFALILPSIIIGVIVAKFFFAFRDSHFMQAALSGVRPVTLSLMIIALLSIGQSVILPGGAAIAFFGIDWAVVGVALVALVFLLATKINPIWVIIAAGVFGGFFLR